MVKRLIFKKPIVLTLLLLMVCPVLFSCLVAGQSDAKTEIGSAKSELTNCYQTVKAVETRGANVTGLIATLNSAAQLLNQADLAYLAENYSFAVNLAQQSKARLSGFDVKASLVKNDALNNENLSFYTDALLVVAGFVIFCVGIAVWFTLGKFKPRSVSGQ
jgi:hypothetical protein